MTFKSRLLGSVSCSAAVSVLGLSLSAQFSPAHAQTAPAAAPAPQAEQVIVTGTRDPNQTARKSISPVIVITGAQLQATGQVDVRDALAQIAPSITRPDMAGGNANLIDALSLRGLTSDQTLVLVNGKRRHTTAVIADYEGPQTGTTPVDVDMIPTSAVDHIEVLQDGAAALYGSDAIAGVVNIILKSNTSGGGLQATNGGYYAADGFTSGESATAGMKLGESGFFDLSAEYKHQDHTQRGGNDDRVNAPDNPFLGNPQENRESLSYNAGYDISPNLSLYSFATYGHRNGDSYQNFRTGATLPEVYPDGFVPQISINSNDYSFTGGIKGTLPGDWTWDLSTTYGGESDGISIFDTVNTSLYADTGSTPTRFFNMSFANTQWTTDLGFKKAFETGFFAGPVNFAVGGQYIYDTYRVGAGSPDSYYGSGPQAEDGLSPLSNSNSNRDIAAAYADVSSHVTDHLQVDLAGRFEHYTDAGDTETGKASARYDFGPFLAVRGAVSNGFRAPSLAEDHYTSLGVLPTGAQGILAVDSLAAKLLGAVPLKPERSTNFSAGLVSNPAPNLTLSLDAYQIDIRDRIVLGGVYNGQTAINALTAQGIQLPPGVIPADVSAQYFANAASTTTQGLDAIGRYVSFMGDYGRIDWDAELNWNQTDVTKVSNDRNGNPLLNKQGIGYISTYFPKTKLIVGGRWTFGRTDVSLHEVRYGSAISQLQYTMGPNAYSNTDFLEFVNQPKYVTNIQVGYHITPALRLALGANNLFNVYPSAIPYDTRYLGVYTYDYTIEQVGINGGFYYLQASWTF
jgi:iron complex outermembrane receptor protein